MATFGCQNGPVTTTEPQAAYPPEAGAPPSVGRGGFGRPRRWIVVLTVAWVVVLAAGIGWAVARGEPTAREQTTVAEAQPVVDRAVGEIATAANADGLAVVAISGFQRVGDCAVTVLRSGQRYQRVVTAVVPPGTEVALLDRVAARLPAAFGATVRKGSLPRLAADAGFWVGITGSTIAPGVVRFVADTGDCRPAGDLTLAAADEGDRSAAAAVLARLGVPASQWSTHRATCAAGGSVTTVEAIGADFALPGSLDAVLHDLGGPAVVATPDLYAYRAGTTGLVVRIDADRIIVTATTPCS